MNLPHGAGRPDPAALKNVHARRTQEARKFDAKLRDAANEARASSPTQNQQPSDSSTKGSDLRHALRGATSDAERREILKQLKKNERKIGVSAHEL
ncbi:hypothetical protein ScalyP_jg2145 [Parmales sp. scaly parma]|nr:hypothetical protein ScalyP_jg2145 [Parmales sp. scaly parma]